MKKLTRREFVKLSAIWGVVPFMPKWLSFKEAVPDEEELEEELEEEAAPNPFDEDGFYSPYFISGGSSISRQTYTNDGPLLVWYDDEGEHIK